MQGPKWSSPCGGPVVHALGRCPLPAPGSTFFESFFRPARRSGARRGPRAERTRFLACPAPRCILRAVSGACMMQDGTCRGRGSSGALWPVACGLWGTLSATACFTGAHGVTHIRFIYDTNTHTVSQDSDSKSRNLTRVAATRWSAVTSRPSVQWAAKQHHGQGHTAKPRRSSPGAAAGSLRTRVRGQQPRIASRARIWGITHHRRSGPLSGGSDQLRPSHPCWPC